MLILILINWENQLMVQENISLVMSSWDLRFPSYTPSPIHTSLSLLDRTTLTHLTGPVHGWSGQGQKSLSHTWPVHGRSGQGQNTPDQLSEWKGVEWGKYRGLLALHQPQSPSPGSAHTGLRSGPWPVPISGSQPHYICASWGAHSISHSTLVKE